MSFRPHASLRQLVSLVPDIKPIDALLYVNAGSSFAFAAIVDEFINVAGIVTLADDC